MKLRLSFPARKADERSEVVVDMMVIPRIGETIQFEQNNFTVEDVFHTIPSGAEGEDEVPREQVTIWLRVPDEFKNERVRAQMPQVEQA